MSKLRLAVVGSREWTDAHFITEYLNSFPEDITLVSGGARGVDKIAETYAKDRGWETLIILADWSQGKGAGFARNADIIANADVVVAFWDGSSKGTKNTIDRALSAKNIQKLVIFKSGDF